MPFDLRISHAQRLATISVHDTFNEADLDRIVVRLVQEKALPYGKLVDLRGVLIDLSASSLHVHAGRLSAYALDIELGRLALVVDSETRVDPSTLVALAAAARRPYRIFSEPATAVKWLRQRE